MSTGYGHIAGADVVLRFADGATLSLSNAWVEQITVGARHDLTTMDLTLLGGEFVRSAFVEGEGQSAPEPVSPGRARRLITLGDD